MMPFSNKSIPLITFDPLDNSFSVGREAAEYLCTLNRPVAVVSIAGLYRTGKSFLVNKLIKSRDKAENNCFRVGGTTQSVTKGLSIWGSPISVTNNEGDQTDYLLIDSEGIGSCERNNKYDTNILVLLFLISSTVVYNSLNAIDELGLEQLQVVLEFKKCIQGNQHLNPAPQFIWVLRDFSLQLMDADGNELTANQYLQKCLQESSAQGPETRHKNDIRRAIKQNLGKRSCYTLVRPTIKQEDLQSFTEARPGKPPKIRTEFLGQVEELKEEIFSGRTQDVKVIEGQKITGRILFKIIQQYIAIINDGQLPNVSNVWDSIMCNKNQEIFEACIDKLKNELKRIALPVSGEELKIRINEIESRLYSQLQAQLSSQSNKYYRLYIQASQKLNAEIKLRNEELRTNEVLRELRKFVKDNVDYESISPLNVGSVLKNLIERMKLKTNGSGCGYQYLLSVINDILFIVEQKANKTSRENGDARLIIEKLESEQKQHDFKLIALKKEYHEALKTISKLQESQAQVDKEYVGLKSQVYEAQSKYKELESTMEHEISVNSRKHREQNGKLRSKCEQLSESVKVWKMKNDELHSQLETLKECYETNQIKERKEIIFEEKMQQIYNKFTQEKSEMAKSVQKSQDQVKEISNKYEETLAAYDQACQREKDLRAEYQKKQRSFLAQLEQLKICIKDTKQSYESTYQTKHNNDQALRDLENLTSVKKTGRSQVCNPSEAKAENNQRDYTLLKNYYERQLEKIKQDTHDQIEQLQQKLHKAESELSAEGSKTRVLDEQSQYYQQKYIRLEGDITEANRKFTNCVREMEEVRQNQRKLYEESIVRLLKNMEKRTGANHSRNPQK